MFGRKRKDKRPNLYKYIFGLVTAWTFLYVTGLGYEIFLEKKNTEALARIQAHIAYEKDVVYRRWNAMHGGVYAPVTGYTLPNPDMSGIKERDIHTPSNRELTLINPDYMLRQANELAAGESGIMARITSLTPIRKENAPDPWEAKALNAFRSGRDEVSSIEKINGKEYMRLIRPLFTEEGCLQCHPGGNYRIGDIHGGISVAVPMRPLRIIESRKTSVYALLYTFTYITGLVVIAFAGKRLVRSDQERKASEERLAVQHTELQKANMNLETLYRVSSTISQTLDMDILLDALLETVTRLELFSVKYMGGIFIIEGDEMKLVTHLGHSEEFFDLHKGMKVGDCLCGLAAESGEIIVSGNCHDDSRHTIRLSDMSSHGHIIVPLKAINKVIGVLYLYIPADTHISENKLNLLHTIGNQVGTAIENSRLFEETKALSLHDPLTGLANRRFMTIVLTRSFARAKRHERPLSVIMLDIDNFKDYNDRYGHSMGDKILTDVADVLMHETREIDLSVRYGGEEFLVLLPETDLQKACDIAERIRTSVKSRTGITISVGVSSYTGEPLEEDLVKKADNALYEAKQKGKDCVKFSPHHTTN